MSHSFIGIDPGLKGGIAAIRGAQVAAVPMPVQGGEIDAARVAALLTGPGPFWTVGDEQPVIYIEKVGAMPKQGVASTFKFGKGYGMILGVCAACRLPVGLVTPQRWKGVVLDGTPKDKDAALAWCARVFPGVSLIPEGCRVPQDGLADALCIAEFARRVGRETPPVNLALPHTPGSCGDDRYAEPF